MLRKHYNLTISPTLGNGVVVKKKKEQEEGTIPIRNRI
jgi:hypothetical protein